MANPTELQTLVRRAVRARLVTDAALTALVPEAAIDPIAEVPWPLISFGAERSDSLRMSCSKGSTGSLDLHIFATATKVGETVVVTGRDNIARIAKELERVLAENWLTLADGSRCKIWFSDRQLIRDGKVHDWHWFAQLNCRVLAPVS